MNPIAQGGICVVDDSYSKMSPKGRVVAGTG
jgi:hypothetical protein